MKRTENQEAFQMRRAGNLETWTMDVAELKRENFEIHKKNNEFRARGSMFLPDGTLIKGNKAIDSKPIDPRTPQGFGHQFFRELRAEINMESDLSNFIANAAFMENITMGIDAAMIAEEALANETKLYAVPRYLPILGVTLGPGIDSGLISLMIDDIPEPSRYSEHPRAPETTAPDQTYIDADLGDVFKITNITVWHYYLDSRAYYSQTIELSEDGDFVNNGTVVWKTGMGNLGPVETDLGNTIVLPSPQPARYIRHRCGGNTKNRGIHFIEIAVHGMSLEPTTTQDPTAGNTTTALNGFEEYQPAAAMWPCENPCDCYGNVNRGHRKKCLDVCSQSDLKSILLCNDYSRYGKLLKKMMQSVRHEKKSGTYNKLKRDHPLGLDEGKPFKNMI